MSLPSPTDLDLVRGLHARDPETLTRVYGDYNAAVYNLCARILGDREEARDVTQDVFLKAFSKPPAATGDVRLRAWLFRVATNACLNLLRARRPSEPLVAEALPATGDPYEQARTAALIESSLAGLNDRYRAALVLKDLHGLDGRELAEVLEVSRPAADVLVHRARASFRRVFAGLAGGDAVAPVSLALALPMLPVPAALQALPLPLLHPPALTPGAVPTGPALVATGAGTAAASGAGPAAGLLAKIGAALGTKAAVVAAGAAVVAGGGVATVKLTSTGDGVPPARAAASPATLHHGPSGGAGGGHGRDQEWARHRHGIAAGLAAHHAAETAGHAADAHRAADAEAGHGGEAAATHDAVTHDSATTPEASPGTTSTTDDTHDGGDAGHDDGH
jgi:RNA polymerase sigma-70 factor (ECF subfamily)